MAGKTPVHSGVIFYPKDRIAVLCILLLDTQTVLAADMWTQAETIMKDVYSKILGISTIAAIVTASVALLLMNFSKSGRTVDESRAWLKRIVISWAILNGLGFIMAYITPFFSGGPWHGHISSVLSRSRDNVPDFCGNCHRADSSQLDLAAF